MDRDVIEEWVKRGQLGITLALLAFAPAAYGAVRPFEFAIVQWGILLLALLWLVRLWVEAPFRFWLPPVSWAMVPFVAYAGWRASTADVEFIARQEFLQIAFLALYFFVLITNLHGQNALRAIVIGLIVIATVISMYGIYQWITKSPWVLGFNKGVGYYNRGSGTYVSPNNFAGLVEMCLPLALVLVMSGRLKILPRIFLGYAAGVMLVGIAASGSRGGWLCTAVSLFTMVAILAKRRKFRWTTIVVAALVGVAGFWLYSRTIEDRVQNTFLTGHQKESRFWIWEAAIKVWQLDPWRGVGPDHFDQRYRAFRIATDKTQGRPGRVHNDYLNTLVDYGVIGLSLLLVAIGVAAWSTICSWPYLKRSSDDLKARESNRSALVLGSACGLLAILVHSFFDFNMHVPANAFVAVTLLAVISSHLRFATSRWWFTARWPLKLIGSAALCTALAFLGNQTWHRTREAAGLRRADKAVEGSRQQIEALRRAVAAEPNDPDAWFSLGEHLRAIAFLGNDGYEQVTREAMEALAQSMKLNRWDPVCRIRYGMCLDWLGKYDEALPYFEKALSLDPNYFLTREMLGWHYFQAGDLDKANYWNEESLKVNWLANPHGQTYRAIIYRMMQEKKKGGLLFDQ